MATEAIFRHGDPTFINYTPTGAVAAGQVIDYYGADLAGGVVIAHLAIAANTLGAVAARGGVYDVPGDAAIAAGVLVFWDDTANKVTATTTANRRFGYAVEACTGDGDVFLCLHDPA